ncbi:MAG: hypothetical protein ACLGIV_06445 [Actinomycetes bacterium]
METSTRRLRPVDDGDLTAVARPGSLLDTAPAEDVATVLRASLRALHAAEEAVARVRALHARSSWVARPPLDTPDEARPDPAAVPRDRCSHCLLGWPCPTVSALDEV